MDDVVSKAHEFSAAMKKYHSKPFYNQSELFFSVVVVLLQLISVLLFFVHLHHVSVLALAITFVVAYVATDFINGLVHMLVDNNTNYTSVVGPYIAAFHLHHAKLVYAIKHPVKIYFIESGHKFWLLGYLVGLTVLQLLINVNSLLEFFLVVIGVFSSVAEVSHYWCHNEKQTNQCIQWLQRIGVLLSLKHHRAHHVEDNVSYAFLNGCTDPLLNRIAKIIKCKGYKNHSDKHVALYMAR